MSAPNPWTSAPPDPFVPETRQKRSLKTSSALEGAFSVGSLAGKPIPRREWAVEGLVPWRAVTLFSAHGGDGKSTLALQLSVAATLGQSWLGFPTKACKVGYVSCEDDADEVHRRLSAICAGEGIDLAALSDFVVFDRVGRVNTINERSEETGWKWDTTPWFAFLMSWAIETGVQILILDSLYDFFGGDQLNQTAASEFMGALRLLATEINGAVIALWHPSQSGRTSKEGTSGVNAFHNKSRGRIFMESDENNPDVRVIRSLKQNYGPKAPEFLVKWDDGRFVRIDGVASPVSRRLAADPQLAFDALNDLLADSDKRHPGNLHVPTNTLIVGQQTWRELFYARKVADTVEAKKKAFGRAVTKLQQSGFIGTFENIVWAVPRGTK